MMTFVFVEGSGKQGEESLWTSIFSGLENGRDIYGLFAAQFCIVLIFYIMVNFPFFKKLFTIDRNKENRTR